jgi:hypothetical protein
MNKTKRIIFSLIFFFLAELFVLKDVNMYLCMSLSFLMTLFYSWYYIKRSAFIVIISLLAPAQFLFLNILESDPLKHFMIFLFSLFFYSLFTEVPKRAHIIVVSFFELILYVFIVFFHSYFYGISSLSYFLIIFLITFSLFFSSISGTLNIKRKLKNRLFYFSLIAGVVVSEFFWIMTKLPFNNFLTSAFMVFLFYYAMWDVAIRYFAGSLTRRAIIKVLIFMVLILLAIFTTVKWFLG